MRELAKTYDPQGIEDKLYQKWLEKKYFHAEVVVPMGIRNCVYYYADTSFV